MSHFTITIHGGAGTILKKHMTPEKESAYRAGLQDALTAGYELLEKGARTCRNISKMIAGSGTHGSKFFVIYLHIMIEC